MMKSSIPWEPSIFIRCQRMGAPPISTIGFGRTDVSSARRLPSPPARITAFTADLLFGAGFRSPYRVTADGDEEVITKARSASRRVVRGRRAQREDSRDRDRGLPGLPPPARVDRA